MSRSRSEHDDWDQCVMCHSIKRRRMCVSRRQQELSDVSKLLIPPHIAD